MKNLTEAMKIWSIAMIILVVMASTASAVTGSDLGGNSSVTLSDTWGEIAGTKIEASATTPSFAGTVSADVTGAGLYSVSLYQSAVDLATELVGTSYLWGGKGFDYQAMKFADAKTIKSGYTYYDPLTGTNKVGKGVDCSGLVFWSFNKAYGATKYKDTSNPVYYEGAANQWSDSSRFQQKSTSVPTKGNLAVGDLLFIGTANTKTPDHVGIYIGNGNVIHSKGSATIEIKSLDNWLNLPIDSTRKYRDCFTGYGSVITSVPSESAAFSIGDSVEVQNTFIKGLKIRVSPAGEKIGNVYDGARGQILDGPKSASLEGLTYTWWKVQWDDGQIGWSTEGYPEPGGVYYLKKIIPTTGSISITTTPAGAAVYLDDTYRGTTPVTLASVSAGTHTVKLTLSGYLDSEESVQVNAGQTVYITKAMQPVPTTGSISITTTPAGAAVYLDDTYRGTTPVTLASVSAGTHTVKLTLSGYLDSEESVQVNAGQTVYITKAMQPVPTTGSVSIQPQSSTLTVGQTQAFTIVLDAAPDGLSGFNITADLLAWSPDGPSPDIPCLSALTASAGTEVCEMVGVTYPSWAEIPMNSSFPADHAFLKAVDIKDSVKLGATNVTLCTLTIRGDAPGTAVLRVTARTVDDDIGNRYEPTFAYATLTVQAAMPFPNPAGGNFPTPRDLDGDGLYEDLDGNGLIGFNDVVIYYQNMAFIESSQPLAAFDYDGSGFIGFNDVVRLYQRV